MKDAAESVSSMDGEPRDPFGMSDRQRHGEEALIDFATIAARSTPTEWSTLRRKAALCPRRSRDPRTYGDGCSARPATGGSGSPEPAENFIAAAARPRASPPGRSRQWTCAVVAA
jgi:hypothetical protein